MSIQSVMLVLLGFLTASLIGLLLAPAFWRRAVRLTTDRLKRSLPFTEAEIRADKDRIRAEYAIQVHKLETSVDKAMLERARHLIDINRRDARISDLESEMQYMSAGLEEHQNARRVLEQTLNDRLPKVENRLSEAKNLLYARDREISELTQSADRQRRALEEAAAINAQQQAELERLGAALTARGSRNQHTQPDARFAGEVAFRSELEVLRTKTREQASLIDRLQSTMGRGTATGSDALAAAETDRKQAGVEAPEPMRPVLVALDAGRAELERSVRVLEAKTQDQAGEIARLKAALATFEAGADESRIKDSKIALKARLGAVQAQAEAQSDTIRKLRAELAAANERLALQASHFAEEMRRFGSGTVPAADRTRRPAQLAARRGLGVRVTNEVAGARNGQANGGSTPVSETKDGNGQPTAPEAGVTEQRAEAQTGTAEAREGKPRLLDRIASLAKG